MLSKATTINLSSVIEHHARLAPDKEALVWNEMRFTYGQLNALANRVAHALVEMGIGYGDKVALSCPNLPFFPIVYYGIMKAGAAVVPLSVLFKPREIAYHLKDSDAKAVFVFEGTAELPLAQAVKAGFDEVETCEHLVVMTVDPTAPSPFEDCRTLTQITFDKPEGRRTDASEFNHERDDDLRHSSAGSGFHRRRAENLSHHPAAFSHDRSDRADEHEYVCRQPHGAAAAL
jgi:acyl-CoA synthetase (AMP-forming)/AMP-acid ligase II